ncbi:hypothetical protein K435DRAFT_653306 [Dendrothele bispora CBS 962.96]|uniref:histidine kinase n=1 Tax=Dendrothele bispora (strain CBS 962.96) TaxID=1314807 RepID=A0A4S8MJ19_DENBC|nr:hypothetical protein K435DRAFT_653306 [Dendrothele bispora CBS 962.96]
MPGNNKHSIRSRPSSVDEHDGAESVSTGRHEIQREDFQSTTLHSARRHGKAWGVIYVPWIFARGKVWPRVKQFFNSRFKDKEVEMEYRAEDWAHSKRLALWASVFFLMNWIFGAAFIATPAVLADKVRFEPIFTIPLLFMCAYDWPRDHSNYYQIFLCISTWAWSYYQVLFGFLCGYTGDNHLFTCGSKDFLPTFYYTTALQTVALFGTNLKRLPATVGATIFLILSACLIIPQRSSWARNVVNFALFQVFILYMHYQREQSARRLFSLRVELKIQWERTRKAQLNQRKTADSKHRLTSYVRVPLNTALLAVQNMSASGTIAKSQELEFNALEGSLSMMSKVLNDVLDFNRMDSGKFESVARPYSFHQVMRSMFLPLRLATNHRGLELITDLDMNIDEVARRAAYEALGEDSETIDRHLKDQPSGESNWGMVVGDETRLRQIVTNLASNACKFTPAGGSLTIRTRLVHPTPATSNSTHVDDAKSTDKTRVSSSSAPTQGTLSIDNLKEHERHTQPLSSSPLEKIVVRVEVTDTGSGIRPQDMAQTKLFSAFNQTEQGRRQGGKGTGLGLALVRLIVQLSNGRLGIRSKVGRGSTFWFDLPLGVGASAISHPDELEVSGTEITSRRVPSEQWRRPATHRHESMKSKYSILEAVDVACLRATQASPLSMRSNSALHGLMDQGGSVELSLANYGSHSTVPTRTIGDPSTGTDYPSPDPFSSPKSSYLEDSDFVTSPTEQNGTPSTTTPANSVMLTERPRHVALPSPKTFTTPLPTSGSNGSIHSPSPLSNQAFPPDPSSTSSPLVQDASSSIDDRMHVLVVDDDKLTRTLMQRLMERLGCTVTTAENGEIALKILLEDSSGEDDDDDCDSMISESCNHSVGYHRRHRHRQQSRFSIVFLDNQMPVLSGLKVVEKLRELGRHDFVVGVTGNALISDQKEYLDAGVDHVLTKPVLERSLKSMLQLAEERRRLLRLKHSSFVAVASASVSGHS